MAPNYQALVDMFRQSFQPVADLGAGQFQMALARQQRDYAERQQQAQRAQAMQDQFAGLEAQNRFAVARDTARDTARFNEADMMRQWQSVDQGSRDAAQFNRDDMMRQWALVEKEAGRSAKELEELQSSLAGLGVEDIGDDPAKLRKQYAGEVKSRQKVADRAQSSLDTVTGRIEALSAKIELPEAEKIKTAKRILTAAAGDDKKKLAVIAKLASLDDVYAAADELTVGRIDAQIATAQKDRLIVYSQQIAPLKTTQDKHARILMGLERQKIFPTFYDDGVAAAPAAPRQSSTAGGLSVEDQALNDNEMFEGFLGGVPALAVSGVAPPVSAVKPPASSGWGFLSDAINLAARGGEAVPAAMEMVNRGGVAAARAAVGERGLALMRRPGELVRESGARSLAAWAPDIGLTRMPKRPAVMMNIPELDGSGFMPDSLAGLIMRASGSGDIETAARLRAEAASLRQYGPRE